MTSPSGNLTPEIACEALRAAGPFRSADEIQLVAREERWAFVLPGERLAWFPASEIGEPPVRRRAPGPALACRLLLFSGAANSFGVGGQLRGPPNGSAIVILAGTPNAVPSIPAIGLVLSFRSTGLSA